MKIKLISFLLLATLFSKSQEPVYVDTYNLGYIFNDSLNTSTRMKYPKGDSIWDLFIDKKNGVFILQNSKTKNFSQFNLTGQKQGKDHLIYTAITGKDTRCIIEAYKDNEYSVFSVVFGIIRQEYRRKLK